MIYKIFHHIFKEFRSKLIKYHQILKLFYLFNIFHHRYNAFHHIIKQFKYDIYSICLNNSETPLHIACEIGNFEIVKLLLSQNNININSFKTIQSSY